MSGKCWCQFVAGASLRIGIALLAASWPEIALADAVIGNGTSSSCTASAFNSGMNFGGLVTFNCGGAPRTITLTSTRFIQVDTILDGGGLITISGGNSVTVFSVLSGVEFIVRNLTVANGGGNFSGAGIFNAATLTVENSVFSGNQTNFQDGGAIYNNGGTLTVTNSTFSGNRTNNGGGSAIINSSAGSATVTNSTFSGNSTFRGVGTIFSGDGSTLTVTASTFSGNTASGSGNGAGAIGTYCGDGGTITIANSTFSGNSTTNVGGALGFCDAMATVSNSTFSGNSSPVSSGAIHAFRGSLTITNSIIANSTGPNCHGGIIDGGHNIESTATCGFAGSGCSMVSGSSLCNTQPHLAGSLATNGGPTQTIALLPGSPAVDGGNDAACAASPVNGADQRGFARPGAGHTHCSIGAYELHILPTSTPAATNTVTHTPSVTATRTTTSTPTASPSSTPSSTPTSTPGVSGQIRYYNGSQVVSGVNVSLQGIDQQATASNTQGRFAFTNVVEGNRALLPSKTGGLSSGITSLDASHVLQVVVGKRSFSAVQMLAADVTGNGSISSLDAARILQFVVNKISRLPVAEACGSDWAFVPVPATTLNQTLVEPLTTSGICEQGTIIYTPLVTPVRDQDFLGVLFGDASGNWTP